MEMYLKKESREWEKMHFQTFAPIYLFFELFKISWDFVSSAQKSFLCACKCLYCFICVFIFMGFMGSVCCHFEKINEKTFFVTITIITDDRNIYQL